MADKVVVSRIEIERVKSPLDDVADEANAIEVGGDRGETVAFSLSRASRR